VCGRIREARVAVEAPPRSQTDEDLARASLELSLQLDRVVARVEDEQGDAPSPSSSRTSKASTCSAATTLASWAGRTRSTSTGAVQLSRTMVELCDDLVGPPGDDGLAGGVAGRMIVVAALATRLGVAAIPHARVNGVDGRVPFGASERIAG
jgi:hypothetical protein